MIDRILRFLSSEKAKRIRTVGAFWILIISLVAAVINVGLYVAGIIDENMLILVTLILSWLAITFTCWDVLTSSQVYEENGDE